MSYKITIRRKNGSLLIKETRDKIILAGYIKTAKLYGDKIVSVEERIGNSQWKPFTDLILGGATLGIGLGILQGVGNILKK